MSNLMFINNFEMGRKILMLEDINVRDEKMEDILKVWGVSGTNENSEFLVDFCAEVCSKQIYILNIS